MKERIERVVELGKVPPGLGVTHEGFKEWNRSRLSRNDHQTILEVHDRIPSSPPSFKQSYYLNLNLYCLGSSQMPMAPNLYHQLNVFIH